MGPKIFHFLEDSKLLKFFPMNELGSPSPHLPHMRPLEFSWEVKSGESEILSFLMFNFLPNCYFSTQFLISSSIWADQLPLFLTVLFQVCFSPALLLHILFSLALNLIIIPTISFTVIYDFIKALRFVFRFLIC